MLHDHFEQSLPSEKPDSKKISNPRFLILSKIIATISQLTQPTFCEIQRSDGFEFVLGKFFVCKMINLCSSFIFRAPKQIWNSVFKPFLGHPLYITGDLLQITEMKCVDGTSKIL